MKQGFLFIILLVAINRLSMAQFFHIDSTFATNGYFMSSMPGYDRASALAIQADCKIITVGHVGTSSFKGTCVVSRFHPQGIPDSSFGLNGVSTFSFFNNDQLNVVKLQSDGKIVVAGGRLNKGLGVARLLPDGRLDSTFGNGGKVLFSQSSSKLDAPAMGLAIQPQDGKMLIATISRESHLQSDYMTAILRLMPNGALDTTFSADGKALLDIFPGVYEVVSSFVLQPDGKMIVSAQLFFASSPAVLLRLLADGTVDRSFGNNGFASVFVGKNVTDLQLLPDGRIVGIINYSSPSNPTLACFLPNGGIDSTFGLNGIAPINPPIIPRPGMGGLSLNLAEDEKIVIAGRMQSHVPGPDIHSFFLARFNTDGTFDTTFAPKGYFTADLDGDSELLYDIAPHGTGFIAAGAYRKLSGQNDLVILRIVNGTVAARPSPNFTCYENGLTVTFSNTSVAATDYLWDFGDGQISSLAEPEHTYANDGVYHVKLIAFNKCVANEIVQTINVSTTHIEAIAENNDFAIYPNLGNSFFSLKMNRQFQRELNDRLFDFPSQYIDYQYIITQSALSQLGVNFSDVPQEVYTLNTNFRNNIKYMRMLMIR